jgi:putative spermidine/putrescine transport system permease protein
VERVHRGVTDAPASNDLPAMPGPVPGIDGSRAFQPRATPADRARALLRPRFSPSFISWLQAGPMMLVFLAFFLVPLVFVVIVSFWDYNEYQLLPAFSGRGYTDTFEGCIAKLPELCTIGRTYVKTVEFCFLVWAITLFIGFWVAYFLAFHVKSKTWQMGLSLLCTIPFWTSNVIRMIAWIPLLGRNGLVNSALVGAGLVGQPVEWLLYSEFSVVLALVHLFTFFMVVPIFNSMIRIDKALIEAAYDAGASGLQTLVNVVIPLAKPGIVIGSIFVITIVMGDFVTIGVMGGQQIAAAGKIIETRLNALQFPAAAANAVILLAITFLIISMMSRIVDIRKEL